MSNKVRHFCPPGYDKGHALQCIERDLKRDVSVGIERIHEFHPHSKDDACNLDECRRIEIESDESNALLIDTPIVPVISPPGIDDAAGLGLHTLDDPYNI